MTDVTIDQFPLAGTIVVTDEIAGWQSSTVKYTYNQLLTFFNANTQLASLAQVTGLAALLAAKLALTGGTLSGALVLAGDATANLNPVTLQQLNTYISSLPYKGICRVATTAALSASYVNGTLGVGATLTNSGTQAAIVIDGVMLNVNDIVLVKNQATIDPVQNGIYFVSNVGSASSNWVLTRATYYDTVSKTLIGTFVNIGEGTVNKNLFFQLIATPITMGFSPILFSSMSIDMTSINIGEGQVSGLITDLNTLTVAISTLNTGKQNQANILDAITSLGSNGIIARTGTNTASGRQLSSSDGSITITNADGIAGNPNLVISSTITPIGKHAWPISLGSMCPALTLGATIVQRESSVNQNNFRGFSFAQTGNNYLHFRIAMPKSWDGSSVTFVPIWKTLSTTGNVVWGFSGRLRSNGVAEDASFGSIAFCPASAAGATAYAENIATVSTAMSAVGTVVSGACELEIRINRNGGSGSDTLADTAILTSLTMYINVTAGNDA